MDISRRSEKQKPSFIQIISNHSMENGQLKIPAQFVREHGKHLPQVVALKLPNGAVWDVELIQIDNGIRLFQRGWQEFVEHHSIGVGHLLSFSYDVNKSEFSALIFDTGGTEIGYRDKQPLNLVHKDEAEHPKNALEIVGASSCIETDSSERALKITEQLKKTGATRHGVIQKSASSFKSDLPFFKVSMEKSYVGARYVPIPPVFWKNNLPKGLDSVTLEAAYGGARWLVGCRSNHKLMRMSNRITAFITESGIQVGDVCVFELIKKNEPVLKFYIFSEE